MTGHIVIVGLMGAGKTTFGQAVAVGAGRPLVDSDEVIATRQGRTGAEIAAIDGVADLHQIEAALLLEALQGDEPSVICAAAATVEDIACVAALDEPYVVWLDVPTDVIGDRLSPTDHRRALPPGTTSADLLVRRGPVYRRVADQIESHPIDVSAAVTRVLDATGAGTTV